MTPDIPAGVSWAPVPIELVRSCRGQAVRVWAALHDHGQAETHDQLAEQLGINRRTVLRAIDELASHGYDVRHTGEETMTENHGGAPNGPGGPGGFHDTPEPLAVALHELARVAPWMADTGCQVCLYCGGQAQVMDHLLPADQLHKSYRSRVPTVPSCHSCNSRLGGHFTSPAIADRCQYIARKRGQWAPDMLDADADPWRLDAQLERARAVLGSSAVDQLVDLWMSES